MKTINMIVKILIIIVLILAIALGAFLIYFQNTAIKNVWDEMTYSASRGKEDHSLAAYFLPDFPIVKTRYGGGFLPVASSDRWLTLGRSELEDNETVNIYVDRESLGRAELRIVYMMKFEGNQASTENDYLRLSFIYNTKTKVLVKNQISVSSDTLNVEAGISNEKKDVETILEKYSFDIDQIESLQQRILEEKVLPIWFEGNPNVSQFSMDSLGEFKVVDNTFQNLDK